MVCLILLDLPSPSFDVLEQPVLLLSVYSALINYEKLHDPNPNPDPNTNPNSTYVTTQPRTTVFPVEGSVATTTP